MNFEAEAALTAALFAVAAPALGGVCIRSGAGAARDQWLHLLRDLLPAASALRKIPCNITDSRLLGGLDLAATLRANRPVAERGVLADVSDGVLVIAMSERLSTHTASLVCAAMDQGEIDVARDGLVLRHPTRFGVVALDEGIAEDEFTPRCLLDRCAFLLDFESVGARTLFVPEYDRADIDAARSLLPRVSIDTGLLEALCATALALGAGSVRVSMLAVRAARVLAALEGRLAVTQQDAETAGRLVLAPRASRVPQPKPADAPADAAPSTDEAPPADAAPPANAAPSEKPAAAAPPDAAPPEAASQASPQESPPQAQPQPPAQMQQMQDLVLAATQAAIPSGLLSQLRMHGAAQRAATMGRFGALRKGAGRGRPTGVAPAGAERSRLNVMATLRAAAPWQSIRGRRSGQCGRLDIRASDLRVTRYKQRSRTLTIFAVDASGSSALNRLAETKGAAELLLADCYVRRDQVAVIAFRGRTAEVVLPPTRSLVRAKRSLSALPGGGGTPLAAAIDAAALLASQAQRRGESPIVVMLSDGRGNVGRDGSLGREAGHVDAMSAARRFGAARFSALFVDTSPRPHDLVRDLARSMNATYVPLPFADARSLSRLIGAATPVRAASG